MRKYLTVLFYSPHFSGCGSRIEDTIAEITRGDLQLDSLPNITVLRAADGIFFSLNNRRLYVLKHLYSIGFLQSRSPSNTVKVRIKIPLPREIKKYSTTKCSLSCKIMRERPVSGESVDDLDSTGSAAEEENEEKV